MLTPSYLLHATEPAEEIAERLHQAIINRIIERILRRFKRGDDYILTAQDKWQIEVLQDAGFLLEDIQKEIVAAVPYMQSELVSAMEDAGVRALDYDDAIYRAAGLNPTDLTQSPNLIRIMQRDFEATLGEWTNFTRTTANAAQQTFIRVCDTAYHQAMTGTVSVSQAVKEAIADLITEGISIQYANGYKTTIEAATARAVRTGISQASAHIQLARMDEMEVDLVLVSSHLGARPSHQVWQGKVYSRNGGDDYPDFVESTGYGTVTGLCGANCRHNFGPYFEGMDNPFEQYDAEENKKAYETQQKQRTMERRIRDTKRQTMNWKEAMDKETDPVKKAMFEAEYQRKAALLKRQNDAYRQFCKDNDLKLQSDRISIAKWDRQQAAMAREAARKAQKSVANVTESGIINKKAANRKIDERGRVLNPMPKEQYIRIKDSLTAQGVNVVAATKGDDLDYMLWMKAEGTYSNGWLMHIGEVPSRGTLYEEIIHMAQARKYGELDSSDYVELYAREIEANRKLLKCSGAYKLDDLDIADIKRNLQAWEESFIRRTGVNYDESNYRKNV